MSRFRVVAHRGASGHAPENTFAAFTKAIEMGADAIEIDVHQTADGRIVVIHDDTLERTTDGRGSVASKTLKELQKLDAGSWFSPAFAGERIPVFSEFLELAKGKVGIIVEVKHGSQTYPDIEKTILSLLQCHTMAKDVLISSSLVTVLHTFKRISSTLSLGKVLTQKELWGSLFQPNSFMYKQNLLAQIKEVHPHWSFIDTHFMEWAKSSGMAVIPWTVNKERKIRAMISREVQGVITNFPDIAARALK